MGLVLFFLFFPGQASAAIVSHAPDPCEEPGDEEALGQVSEDDNDKEDGDNGSLLVEKDDEQGLEQFSLDDFVSMVPVETGDGNNNPARVHIPTCFSEREAYMALHSEGLVCLPAIQGVCLSYHKRSMQWHTSWPNGNRAPTWGKIRSERMAILIALSALWQWFVQTNSHDHDAQQHLSKLKNAMADVS